MVGSYCSIPTFFILFFRPRNVNMKKQANNKYSSGHPFIAQLLALIPTHVFESTVKDTQSDRYYKKMKTKEHFICVFYAVLTRNSSLREVCKNIILIAQKLIPLGLLRPPARSTLSDANRKRDSTFFASLYNALYLHYKSRLVGNWLAIGGEVDPSRVDAFDSTTITLFKEILKGAGRKPDQGNRKGGAKAFTKMNLAEGVPNFVCIKAAATNENTFLKVLNLPENGIAVFDKGFNRYAYFDIWTKSNRFFVTGLKENAKYEIVEEKSVDFQEDIVSDQRIRLTYRHKQTSRTVELRLVSYRDPLTGAVLRFLTNLMDLKASTIALLYKNRWVIEVLFKQIKQNFELKYFLSDSENGIKIQIWVALILNLLFTVLHKRIGEAEDFSTMVMVAAKNLCSYINLEKFLMNTEDYCKKYFTSELRNMQLQLQYSG